MTVMTRNIYQRMNEVMREVKAIQKESKKVNGQYTFVSHDAVAEAMHMPMVEAGIVMLPSIEELIQDGNRTRVMMGISFINMDNPEDKCYIRAAGDGIDPQDKGIGKAVSYAVKYGMLKAFCLATGDDVEKDNINHKPAVEPIIETISQNQVMEIEQLLIEREVNVALMLENCKVKSVDDILAKDFPRILKALQMKPLKLKTLEEIRKIG